MTFLISIHNHLKAPLTSFDTNSPVVGVGQALCIGGANDLPGAWRVLKDYGWEILARYPVRLESLSDGCRILDGTGGYIELRIIRQASVPVAA